MDIDEFRRILSDSAVDIWSFIDTAIAVASSDYGDELKDRRDEIVQRLYACRNCGDQVNEHRRIVEPVVKVDNSQAKLKHSPYTPQSVHREEDVDVVNDDEEEDPYAGLFDDDEETRILRIKDQIEDPDQVACLLFN